MSPEKKMIPVYEPYLKGKELEYASDAIRSGWVSSIGEYIKKFEKDFSGYCGVKDGASCSNGTTALHLALKAFGVKEGDEVIVPNVTFIATANAVRYCNAKPVFVDIDESWCIDPEKIREKITKKTRGIIPVHLYGMPADMDPIRELAGKHSLFVLEDCAEAHGARYRGKRVGSLGDASVFSFYGNKVITTGEGGMVLSGNKELIEEVKVLRDHGMNPKKRYWHDKIGYNYRMTNVQAAIGVAQLENIGKILSLKKKLVETYDSILRGNPKISLQPEIVGREKVCWIYTALINANSGKRDSVIEKLGEKSVDSRPFFYPINELPPHRTRETFPKSKDISSRGISLPSSPSLTRGEIKEVCEKLEELV